MQQILTIQITLEELESLIRRVVTEVLREELKEAKTEDKNGPLLSIAQAALLLGVSKVTIWNYRKQGKLSQEKSAEGFYLIKRSCWIQLNLLSELYE